MLSEPLFWKCYRSFFDFGELLKCIRHSLSIVISSRSWFLEPLPHGLVGFQPRSQGLVGSFVPFNPFSLGNSIICGRFLGKPFLGSPSWWAGLIWGPPSLHPFIGSFYTLFKVFFSCFLLLLGFWPQTSWLLLLFAKVCHRTMGPLYLCKANGLVFFGLGLFF